jgi:hypothetical protein
VVVNGEEVSVPPPARPPVTAGKTTCLTADSGSEVVAVRVAEPDPVP